MRALLTSFVLTIAFVSATFAGENEPATPPNNPPAIVKPAVPDTPKRKPDGIIAWNYGKNRNRPAIEQIESTAHSMGLAFAELDASQPALEKKFLKEVSMADLRLPILKKQAIYIQRAWRLPDGTLSCDGDGHELTILIPTRDEVWLYIRATAEPPEGREALFKTELSLRAEKPKSKRQKQQPLPALPHQQRSLPLPTLAPRSNPSVLSETVQFMIMDIEKGN